LEQPRKFLTAVDDIVKGLPNERSLISVPVGELGFKRSAFPNDDKAMTSR
jgi:hypothetical protein